MAKPAAPRTQPIDRIRPMLLTAAARAIDRPGWSAELKWDGYRGICYSAEGRFLSRNARDLTKRFPELAAIAAALAERGAIVDGEIVALVDGVPSFAALQARNAPATFVAFDVLAIDGNGIMQLPLTHRREFLAELVPADSERIIRSRAFASAAALFEQARAHRLEGIVSKRDDSIYVPGPARSRDWIKIKTEHGLLEEKHRQETWGHGSRS